MFALEKAPEGYCGLSFLEVRSLRWTERNVGSVNNLTRCLYLDEPLDEATLIEAVAQVVADNESLRTDFIIQNDEKRRIVYNDSPIVPIIKEAVDLEEAKLLMRQLLKVKFWFGTRDVFAVGYVKIRGGGSLLGVCGAHIVADASSLLVFFGELRQAYKRVQDGIGTWEKKPFGLSDFVFSEQKWVESDACRLKLKKLADDNRSIFDNSQQLAVRDDDDNCFAQKEITKQSQLDSELSDRLLALFKKNKISETTALIAMSAISIGFCFNVSNFFSTVMYGGRFIKELDNITGYFNRPIPFHILFDPQNTCQESLVRVAGSWQRMLLLNSSLPKDLIDQAISGAQVKAGQRGKLSTSLINVLPPASNKDFVGIPAKPISLASGPGTITGNLVQVFPSRGPEGIWVQVKARESEPQALSAVYENWLHLAHALAYQEGATIANVLSQASIVD